MEKMPPSIKKGDLEYVLEFITRVCVEIGPGSPGSAGEKARAAAVKAEFGKITGEVHEERFVCAPGAFLKWFPAASLVGAAAAGFFHLGLLPLNPIIFTSIGLALAVFIFLIMIFEFIYGREFIDWLYPKKPSQNIIGVIRPSPHRRPALAGRRPKRILLLGAHHDSALQFNYLRQLKSGYFLAAGILIGGLTLFAAGMLLRWLSLIFSRPMDWLAVGFRWYTWIYIPLSVFIDFTFTESGKDGGSVPGAVDNLSAEAVLLMIGRALKRNPDWIPAETEIRLVSFGCEEAGARGSLAYVRAHKAELKAADAVFVNFESIYDPEIEIFTSDRNRTIRNSPDVVEGLARAAEAAAVPHRVSHFPFAGGGTDAVSFRQSGIRAACLYSIKIPDQLLRFYHQDSDNYDIINPAALENAARIGLEFIRGFYEQPMRVSNRLGYRREI
jgi:hypothetical protein